MSNKSSPTNSTTSASYGASNNKLVRIIKNATIENATISGATVSGAVISGIYHYLMNSPFSFLE